MQISLPAEQIFSRLIPRELRERKGIPDEIMDGRTFETRSQDGAEIKGWFKPSTGARGVVFLLHGFKCSSCQDELVTVAKQVSSLGWAVVAIDFRHHGISSNKIPTFG